MSWAIGYDGSWQRDIGYGVPAFCDHPNCDKVIDRGLSYVCGGDAYGGEKGCGLYFCGSHLRGAHSLCARCRNYRPAYEAKPDCPKWLRWKLGDHSWATWRAENPEQVIAIRAALRDADPRRTTPKPPEDPP